MCIDGRNQLLREGTGVATYARTLADGLRALGRGPGILLDSAVDRSAAAGPGWRAVRAAIPLGKRARPIELQPAGFSQAWVARDAFRTAQVYFDIHGRLLPVRVSQPPALMHWTYPLPMFFRGTPNVYTVHDLIPLTHPSLTSIDGRRFRRIITEIVRHAAHVVTVSDHARRDLIRLLGLPADRVTTTFQPVLLPEGLASAPPRARTGHFLFCGTIEPRKNIARLIAAHAASGTSVPLILAGPDGWRAAEELAGQPVQALDAASPGALGPGVWRASYLHRDVLLELLRGARALLFPTLAEGFGLPVAEAMALGVPVLTAAGGAAEEIAGGAALLVDPLDVRDMATGIATLANDAARRGALAAAGTRRAGVFTQAACMGRLAEVYCRIETT